MTRLHVMSDLHFEFMRDPEVFWAEHSAFRKKYDAPDALILAGDICSLGPRDEALAARMMERFCEQYQDVIYVAGNHEFYGTSIPGAMTSVLGWGFSNLTVLTPGDSLKLGEYRVVGGTMWFEDTEDPATKSWMSDFRCIQDFEPMVYKEHEDFQKLVVEKLQPKDIVVSHHLPSPRSTPLEFKNSPTNPYFVSDMSAAIRSKKPKLWIHGHSHSPSRYTIGNTQIYANPYGYPREGTNSKFWSRVIVTL